MNQEEYVKRMTMWGFDIGVCFGISACISFILIISLAYLSTLI